MKNENIFSKKIKQLTENLQNESTPYNLNGDDRMLSELTNKKIA